MRKENELNKQKIPLVPTNLIYPFILVTLLFPLWGFPSDLTNPMVKAFKEIFGTSNFVSSFVQVSFYGGYALMAIPAALFIRKFSYKAGILVGLGLFATGSLLFYPAQLLAGNYIEGMNEVTNIGVSTSAAFWFFPPVFLILTIGLAFLETTANPFILSLGDPRTATQRLNLAQAFNPMGSLLGMSVASFAVLRNLATVDAANNQTKELITVAQKKADLELVTIPYLILGMVVLAVFALFLFSKLPKNASDEKLAIKASLKKLAKNRNYIEGVVAQLFYMGAQIMCWTFIVQYATGLVKANGAPLSAAAAQNINIVAMVLFFASRFICTAMLKFISAGKLLKILAIVATGLTLMVILLPGFGFLAKEGSFVQNGFAWAGLVSLVAISGCMSLMFPTIYGIALDKMGDEAKLASAGLIFAILGGSLFPALQGILLDLDAIKIGGYILTPQAYSFIFVLFAFIVIARFGKRSENI